MRTLLLVVVAALALAPAASATFPGKNGRLAYEATDGHLYSILPTGKGVRRISDGIDFGASFSSDGRSIAWSRQEDGPGLSPRNRIWVAAADGSGAHPVTSHDPSDPAWQYDLQPAWKSDGTLLFTRFVGRLTDAACITTVPASPLFCSGSDNVDFPLPSPVGSRLAYFHNRTRDAAGTPGPADELWIDGAPTSVLGSDADWSPDGTRLLVEQSGLTLAIVNVATRAVKPLGVKELGFAWSPDGKQLAYISRSKLWIAAADGTHPKAVASVPGATGLAWQPLPR